jgi:hypothetical protein
MHPDVREKKPAFFEQAPGQEKLLHGSVGIPTNKSINGAEVMGEAFLLMIFIFWT